MWYDESKWDPIKIISQIIALQFLYYLFFVLSVIVISYLFGGAQFSIFDQLFDYKTINFSSVRGMITCLSIIASSFLMFVFLFFFFWMRMQFFTPKKKSSFAIVYVVQRAKLVLDFTCTLYFIHIILMTCFKEFPKSIFPWWVFNLVVLTCVTVIAEYLCQKKELQEIPIKSNEINI